MDEQKPVSPVPQSNQPENQKFLSAARPRPIYDPSEIYPNAGKDADTTQRTRPALNPNQIYPNPAQTRDVSAKPESNDHHGNLNDHFSQFAYILIKLYAAIFLVLVLYRYYSGNYTVIDLLTPNFGLGLRVDFQNLLVFLSGYPVFAAILLLKNRAYIKKVAYFSVAATFLSVLINVLTSGNSGLKILWGLSTLYTSFYQGLLLALALLIKADNEVPEHKNT